MSSFLHEPGFCTNCGTILPLLEPTGGVTCYLCKANFGPEVFGKMESEFIIYFNSNLGSPDSYKRGKDESEPEGPIVERRCPKCGNEKMSYATLQLRSADEGQTVFYTCTKCKFKENENS